ncbi:hypothetical protein IFM89_031623 [Coptis chinensis]|uniref:Homeobox domain-containing protein n=1 Tax=Coptis chinensis TaxID=261450 RepID=A0A835LH36_9MAGN|nr:hypothetical protein IFM89_031623 [Coptis chinensis]
MEEGMSGFYIRATGGRNSSGNVGGTKCGRWNPTAEQVKVLTDLFRSGLRTPSTDQIQKISSQLSFYGKIESKNVFYWFQNHKARERQKRRRVSVDDDGALKEADEKPLPATYFTEIDQVTEPKRVTETLQLFPLNSYDELEPEKLRICRNEWTENTAYAWCGMESEIGYPPLDLRLSFL